MKDWGYNINKDSQIDFDANDRSISDLIFAKVPSFNLCIACGCCTSTCTSAANSDLNISRLFTLLKRGELEEVREKIKLCLLCGKCNLVCPRGVNTRKVIHYLSRFL